MADRISGEGTGRLRIRVPDGLKRFEHPAIVSMLPNLAGDDAPPLSAFVARCSSERGQLVCSCGYYAIAWDDSGIELIAL
jgi:hypothetical protein